MREKQHQGFQKIVARQTPKSVILVEAAADMSKSWLIQRMRHHNQETNVPIVHMDFRDRRPHDYLSLARLAREDLSALASVNPDLSREAEPILRALEQGQ